MIQIDQTLPRATLSQITEKGLLNHDTDELFANQRIVLFGVPGAFTPTCSKAHLPGYVVLADEFKNYGIDMIACVSVNDAFVMQAWAEAQNVSGVMMLGDGDGNFTQALGLAMDTANFGGLRSHRYAMVIDHNVVTLLNVDEPGALVVSKAETILAALKNNTNS